MVVRRLTEGSRESLTLEMEEERLRRSKKVKRLGLFNVNSAKGLNPYAEQSKERTRGECRCFLSLLSPVVFRNECVGLQQAAVLSLFVDVKDDIAGALHILGRRERDGVGEFLSSLHPRKLSVFEPSVA
jgi:hypothetical protein